MRRILILVAIAWATLAVGSGEAQAVIPGPTDVAPAPPPIPALPPAGETPPPADAISDPITPDATCGEWYLQTRYGGEWPTDSTWWEYRCGYEYPPCNPVCNANFVPDTWDDYFYWDGSRDGSQPAFYGEYYGAEYLASLGLGNACAYWWDAPTSQWYIFESPECPAAPPDNAAPTATFTSSCSGLSCSFDASESTDSDGTIDDYRWEFGDGSGGSGKTVPHTYNTGGTYQVKLTVTDNGGATATDSKAVTLIALTARGYKVKGLQKVHLSWSGPSGASFDVYRDASPSPIAAGIQGTSFTDNLDKRGSGTYVYKVCEAGSTATCSNEAKVTF